MIQQRTSLKVEESSRENLLDSITIRDSVPEYNIPKLPEKQIDNSVNEPKITGLPEEQPEPVLQAEKQNVIEKTQGGSKVWAVFPSSLKLYPTLLADFSKGLFNVMQGFTNGGASKDFSGEVDFFIQGARDFKATLQKTINYIETYRANLPDNSKGDEFSKAISEINLVVSDKKPSGFPLFYFHRTKSASELINESKVKNENMEYGMYFLIALGAILVLK